MYYEAGLIAGLGLLLGSFFNVVIYRLPREEGFLSGRSYCPRCREKICWYHNIPVLSYVWLRGRCASCKNGISIEYPLVELLTAGLFAAVIFQFGLTVWSVFLLVFISELIVITFIDLHHQIIPDELSLSGIVIGVVASFFSPIVGVLDSILGVLLGGGLFYFVAWMYEKLAKREGLGGGDIKLLGMLGAWLGYSAVLPIVIISTVIGSVAGVVVMLIGRKGLKTAIPFGPALVLGALMTLFFREAIYAAVYAY